jgi:hypothetical protein
MEIYWLDETLSIVQKAVEGKMLNYYSLYEGT